MPEGRTSVPETFEPPVPAAVHYRPSFAEALSSPFGQSVFPPFGVVGFHAVRRCRQWTYGIKVFTFPTWNGDDNPIASPHGWQQPFHRFHISRKTAIDINVRALFFRRIELKQERTGDHNRQDAVFPRMYRVELAYGLLSVEKNGFGGAVRLNDPLDFSPTGGVHGPRKGAQVDSFQQLRVIRQEHHLLGDDPVILPVRQYHLLLPRPFVDSQPEASVEVGDKLQRLNNDNCQRAEKEVPAK